MILLDPKTNEVIVDTNTMINEEIADKIVDAGIRKVRSTFCTWMSIQNMVYVKNVMVWD